jgi:hypothetical protein
MGTLIGDEGVAIIETPYVRSLVERLEFDTIYHEHLFYYSLTALQTIFERNGLQVVDVERISIHGGSLRVQVRRPTGAESSRNVADLLQEEADLGIGTLPWFQGFAERVSARCDELATVLSDLRSAGKTVAAYGAAAKGTVLLNAIGSEARSIRFVADRNPVKQGYLMPGVRIPIVSPERLLVERPDYTMLLAWNFADEVLAQQAEYRARGGRFIIPTASERILYL